MTPKIQTMKVPFFCQIVNKPIIGRKEETVCFTKCQQFVQPYQIEIALKEHIWLPTNSFWRYIITFKKRKRRYRPFVYYALIKYIRRCTNIYKRIALCILQRKPCENQVIHCRTKPVIYIICKSNILFYNFTCWFLTNRKRNTINVNRIMNF